MIALNSDDRCSGDGLSTELNNACLCGNGGGEDNGKDDETKHC